jgi:hypothetical protein
MSNRKELRVARRRVEEALLSLAGIEALPRRRGARVRWSNGVVWTREGDDAWRAYSPSTDTASEILYPSAHVASGRIVPAPHDSEEAGRG